MNTWMVYEKGRVGNYGWFLGYVTANAGDELAAMQVAKITFGRDCYVVELTNDQ